MALMLLSILLPVHGYAAKSTIRENSTVDFSVGVSPSTLSVSQGSSGTTTVIVNSLDNFSSPVTLGVSGLPSGAVAGFGTNPVTPPPGGSASSPLIISVSSTVSIGTYPLIVTGSNGTLSHSSSLTLKVVSSGDFTIAVSPSTVIVAPMTFASATVTIGSTSSFSSPVSLSATGVPWGLTLTFGPNPVTPPAGGSASSLVTLIASSYAPIGFYTITITGSSGSLSHSTLLTVALTQGGYPDFSLSGSPTTLPLVQGSSGTMTVTATSISGFSAPIGLSVAWVGSTPSGITFSYATIVSPPPGGSAPVTFTVTASSTASVGTFTFRVTGTSGPIRHSIELAVQVSSSTRDFTISLSPNSLSLVQGQHASSTATIQSIGTFASSVTLTSSGAPSGMTVTFGSNPVAPVAGGSASSALTIQTSSSVAVGTYGIVISASGGGLSHNSVLTVSVATASVSDFSVESSFDTITLTPGSSESTTITVISHNGFSSPVLMFASWVSAAPEGTTFSLPSPIVPLADHTATSTLRVTTTSGATLGTFTLRVLGTSGSLTHSVDVTIKITSQCVIATATYGSELSPEVQILRNFRDNMILKTYVGSSFMTVFNTWYYSFSPNIAAAITQNQALRTPMRYALYPLVGILRIGAEVFSLMSGNGEIATIVSGALVSWLLGATYLALPLSVLFAKSSRGSRIGRRLEKILMILVPATLGAITVAELLSATPVMLLLAPTLVLAIMTLSALLTSRTILSVSRIFVGKRTV